MTGHQWPSPPRAPLKTSQSTGEATYGHDFHTLADIDGFDLLIHPFGFNPSSFSYDPSPSMFSYISHLNAHPYPQPTDLEELFNDAGRMDTTPNDSSLAQLLAGANATTDIDILSPLPDHSGSWHDTRFSFPKGVRPDNKRERLAPEAEPAAAGDFLDFSPASSTTVTVPMTSMANKFGLGSRLLSTRSHQVPTATSASSSPTLVASSSASSPSPPPYSVPGRDLHSPLAAPPSSFTRSSKAGVSNSSFLFGPRGSIRRVPRGSEYPPYPPPEDWPVRDFKPQKQPEAPQGRDSPER